jgi:hypothetical protein
VDDISKAISVIDHADVFANDDIPWCLSHEQLFVVAVWLCRPLGIVLIIMGVAAISTGNVTI